MSVNRYKPHVYVIPEDDANRQIADGFVLHERVAARQVQVVAPAGGWARVLELFETDYIRLLRQNERTHVVMVVDFDSDPGRRPLFEAKIPKEVHTRVFVVGSLSTPESLKQSLGKRYEDIGRSLADDCDREQKVMWSHSLLEHNEAERTRLMETVRSFLFAGRGPAS